MKPTHPCSIQGCPRLVYRRDWCATHYHRWRRHGDPEALGSMARGTGPDHPNWGGDAIGYGGTHHRVRSTRGKASAHNCVACGGQAHQWAYDNADPNEVFEGGLAYSPDPSHYQPMCRSCHRRFDMARRRKDSA